MPNLNLSQQPSVLTTFGRPCEGSKTLPILIDFSLGATFNLDLSSIQSLGYIASAQSIYVDNSANTSPLTVTCGVSRQVLTVPPLSCAYMTLLEPNPPVLQIACSNPVKVLIQILNFYLPTFVWGAAATGALVTATIAASIGTLTDRSGTIAVGGTVQAAMAANPTRKYALIHNPTTGAEILQITFGLTTAGRIDLPVGTTWESTSPFITSQAINVVGATGGHAYTAYEG